MNSLKQNVNVFNRDVIDNEGYRYTTHAQFSSIVANRRLTEVTIEHVMPSCGSLIDIGCGDGTYTNDIQQNFPALSIDATDPAVEAIKSAEAKYPKIRFFVSNILEEDSFKGKAREYDLAIIRGVLHHLNDPTLALHNTLALAKNVLIIEPNGNNPVLKLIERLSRYHREHEERSFSSSVLKEFCRQAGGRVMKLSFVGYVPFFFPTIPARVLYFLQPFLEKIPLVRFFLSGQIVILCERERH